MTVGTTKKAGEKTNQVVHDLTEIAKIRTLSGDFHQVARRGSAVGAYRGLSEAVIEDAGTAEGIEWDRWRESRF